MKGSRAAWAQTGYPAAEGSFGWGETPSRVRPNKSLSGGAGGEAPAFEIRPSNQDQILAAWEEFLGRWEWDWFCTLTFRTEIHPEAASKRFRVLISQINRQLFGTRWWKHGQGVRWVRAMEMQRRDVIHYHSLLGGGGLSDLNRRYWMERWNELAGYSRIEQPRNRGAVHSYCVKYVTKGGEIDIGGPLALSAQRLLDL